MGGKFDKRHEILKQVSIVFEISIGKLQSNEVHDKFDVIRCSVTPSGVVGSISIKIFNANMIDILLSVH